MAAARRSKAKRRTSRRKAKRSSARKAKRRTSKRRRVSKRRKTVRRRKKKKVTKKKRKAKKRVSQRGSRGQVWRGTRTKVKTTGQTKKDLMKNAKSGKIVSKKAFEAGQRAYKRNGLKKWTEAFQKARGELGVSGFVPCKKGTELYTLT